MEDLSQDLDFHEEKSDYSSPNFHSFPAKFPPQLPKLFIERLTCPGEVVLDPMAGSGTTVLEAFLANRQTIGIDIDPLATLLTKVKSTPIDLDRVLCSGNRVLTNAKSRLSTPYSMPTESPWDSKTSSFVDYWFTKDTQLELSALIEEINLTQDVEVRQFLLLTFSSIIITKSGGVSLALDLAHTRPHRVKMARDAAGTEIYLDQLQTNRRLDFQVKTLRSPLADFEKRLSQNIESLALLNDHQQSLFSDNHRHWSSHRPVVLSGNAQALPLSSNSVDLIVTSPPYASNAIDYMRAHKFSLVWMQHSIDELSLDRNHYIGAEAASSFPKDYLPPRTQAVVNHIGEFDRKKSLSVARYYSDMFCVLREMNRVLKPGRCAILVVSSSQIKGVDTCVDECLAEIGALAGLETPQITERRIDRNRRMMPAAHQKNLNSMIEKRMDREFVIGFYKPIAGKPIKDNDNGHKTYSSALPSGDRRSNHYSKTQRQPQIVQFRRHQQQSQCLYSRSTGGVAVNYSRFRQSRRTDGWQAIRADHTEFCRRVLPAIGASSTRRLGIFSARRQY